MGFVFVVAVAVVATGGWSNRSAQPGGMAGPDDELTLVVEINSKGELVPPAGGALKQAGEIRKHLQAEFLRLQRLAKAKKATSEPTLLLQADPNAAHRPVFEVLSQARAVGFGNLKLRVSEKRDR